MFEKSALDLYEEEKAQGFQIKTLLGGLDDLLQGGIPSGIITEFCGGSGAGKTHMCMQLCLHVQLIEKFDRVGKAVYIDTNQGFNPYVLKDMVAFTCEKLRNGIDLAAREESFLSNIEYAYCRNVHDMKQKIDKISEKMQNENIKLIVIDSFSFILRNLNVSGQQRTKTIYEILTQLQILADKYEVAVILTNEFTTKILENNEMAIYPSLGEAYAHKIGQRIIFEKGTIQRKIYLHKTLYAPNAWVPFLINRTGIRSINSML